MIILQKTLLISQYVPEPVDKKKKKKRKEKGLFFFLRYFPIISPMSMLMSFLSFGRVMVNLG